MNFFAHRRADGLFVDVYPSEMQVRMCGEGNIIPVKVLESPGGGYWGWKDSEGGISMIWPSLFQLKMCFPYGIEAAEKRGDGTRVELAIEAAK